MKPSVLNAILRLTSLSEDAAAIAAQVVPSSDVLAESGLQTKVEELKREISYLKMELLPVEEPFTDEDQAAFVADFIAHLDKSAQASSAQTALSMYGRSYFLPYSPRVRVAIAKALLAYCDKINVLPSLLWSDIVASLGVL